MLASKSLKLSIFREFPYPRKFPYPVLLQVFLNNLILGLLYLGNSPYPRKFPCPVKASMRKSACLSERNHH